jgi:hypothetical protein
MLDLLPAAIDDHEPGVRTMAKWLLGDQSSRHFVVKHGRVIRHARKIRLGQASTTSGSGLLYAFRQANVVASIAALKSGVIPYTVNRDYFLSRRFLGVLFRRFYPVERYDAQQ